MESPAGNAGLHGFIHTALKYARILLAYRWLIIIVTSLMTLPVLAYLAASVILPAGKSPLPNTYMAYGTILIQPASTDESLYRSILQSVGGSYADAGVGAFDNGELVQEILMSNPIMDQAIDELGLIDFWKLEGPKARAMARDAIRGSIWLSYTRTTGSLKIHYTDINPEFAATMVNSLITYLEEWFNLNRGAAKQRQKEILEEGIRTVTAEIARLQNLTKALQEQYGFIELSDLSSARTALLEDLRQRITDKELEIRRYAAISQIDDARMVQLRQELQDLKDYYADQQKSMNQATQTGSGGASAADVAQRYTRLQSDLGSQQELLDALSSQYRVAKLTYDSAPIFQILERAEPPLGKTGPNRTKILIMASGGGLAAGVALALLINFIRGFRAELKRSGRFTWPD